ncbi:MAG: hypothetical protein MUF38_20170, partial [Anaerolineae bacterium]|nr:hypothetical protein [Anaerolineae bacterium]
LNSINTTEYLLNSDHFPRNYNFIPVKFTPSVIHNEKPPVFQKNTFFYIIQCELDGRLYARRKLDGRLVKLVYLEEIEE